MTTETTPMQDLSTCCEGRTEMTNERVLAIARQLWVAPYTTGTFLVGH